jgi:gluconokinase
MVVILMGVSGSGKSTVGTRLAAALGWSFVEGDAYHSVANIAKMVRGEPLTDADRQPWLAGLRARIQEALARAESVVVACSALKESYRRLLIAGAADGGQVRFVYLKGSPALIRARLAGRTGHYMKPAMLDSQFAALEEPDDPAEALVVGVERGPDELVAEIRQALAAPAPLTAT